MNNIITLKTSMICEACVAKVKPALIAHGIGDNLVFNMASPDKTIEFLGTHESALEAIKILQELGYSAQILNKKSNFFVTYKPIILVFIFLALISSLIEIKSQSFEPMRFMNNFMGGFFIFFSFFKFLNLRAFADAYQSYDIIAKKIRLYGFVYPFLELILGVAYILELYLIITNIIAIIILTLGNIGVWQVLRKKQTIQCACLGTIFDLPMTTLTLFENTLMLLMALASLIHLLI